MCHVHTYMLQLSHTYTHSSFWREALHWNSIKWGRKSLFLLLLALVSSLDCSVISVLLLGEHYCAHMCVCVRMCRCRFLWVFNCVYVCVYVLASSCYHATHRNTCMHAQYTHDVCVCMIDTVGPPFCENIRTAAQFRHPRCRNPYPCSEAGIWNFIETKKSYRWDKYWCKSWSAFSGFSLKIYGVWAGSIVYRIGNGLPFRIRGVFAERAFGLRADPLYMHVQCMIYIYASIYNAYICTFTHIQANSHKLQNTTLLLPPLRHSHIFSNVVHTYKHTHTCRCVRVIRGKENLAWYKMFYVFCVPYTPPAEPETPPMSEPLKAEPLKEGRAPIVAENYNARLQMMAQNSSLPLQQPSRQYPIMSVSAQMPMVYVNQGGLGTSMQYPAVAPQYGQPSTIYNNNYPPMYVGGSNFGNEEAVTTEQVSLSTLCLWHCIHTYIHTRSTYMHVCQFIS